MYLHVRCTSHICNLILENGFKKVNKAILAIRNAMKYVRSSQARLNSFKTYVGTTLLQTFGGYGCSHKVEFNIFNVEIYLEV